MFVVRVDKVREVLLETPTPMFRRYLDFTTHRSAGATLAVAVALILLALAPFAAALEIHHELAAADHDGHQHSDSDLCQWVQHHTSSSLVTDAPAVHAFIAPAQHQQLGPSTLLSSHLSSTGLSRAPPLS